MMDAIKFQYKCYQLEKLDDDFCKLPASGEKKQTSPLNSYWKEAYANLQIELSTPTENEYIGVDEYWYKVLLLF